MVIHKIHPKLFDYLDVWLIGIISEHNVMVITTVTSVTCMLTYMHIIVKWQRVRVHILRSSHRELTIVC